MNGVSTKEAQSVEPRVVQKGHQSQRYVRVILQIILIPPFRLASAFEISITIIHWANKASQS